LAALPDLQFGNFGSGGAPAVYAWGYEWTATMCSVKRETRVAVREERKSDTATLVVSTKGLQIGRFDIHFTRASTVLNTQPSPKT
jgi:hypothetical protein